MAAFFFDTSGIVKRYLKETGTAWVQSVTDPVAANVIFLAGISSVEVISAVTRRQRSGNLTAAEAASILAQFRQGRALEYRIIEITPAILATAEGLAESHALRPTMLSNCPQLSSCTPGGRAGSRSGIRLRAGKTGLSCLVSPASLA